MEPEVRNKIKEFFESNPDFECYVYFPENKKTTFGVHFDLTTRRIKMHGSEQTELDFKWKEVEESVISIMNYMMEYFDWSSWKRGEGGDLWIGPFGTNAIEYFRFYNRRTKAPPISKHIKLTS